MLLPASQPEVQVAEADEMVDEVLQVVEQATVEEEEAMMVDIPWAAQTIRPTKSSIC